MDTTIGKMLPAACQDYIHQKYSVVNTRFAVPMEHRECERLLTAFYMSEVKARGRRYINDVPTKEHINIASKWLINPKMNPGLFLYGGVGNGKSTLARAIRSMINGMAAMGLSTRQLEMVELKAIDVASRKREGLDKIKNSLMLMIDDLGTESPVSYSYGNEFYPITEIIHRRYDRQHFTVITSNLSDEDLVSRYGLAVYDRFKESCDFIAFENASYRSRK